MYENGPPGVGRGSDSEEPRLSVGAHLDLDELAGNGVALGDLPSVDGQGVLALRHLFGVYTSHSLNLHHERSASGTRRSRKFEVLGDKRTANRQSSGRTTRRHLHENTSFPPSLPVYIRTMMHAKLSTHKCQKRAQQYQGVGRGKKIDLVRWGICESRLPTTSSCCRRSPVEKCQRVGAERGLFCFVFVLR